MIELLKLHHQALNNAYAQCNNLKEKEILLHSKIFYIYYAFYLLKISHLFVRIRFYHLF